MPLPLKSRQFLEKTKIPYMSYFSFGEKLPIIEHGVSDPSGIGYACETIAAILANNFNSLEYMDEDRGEFIERAHKDYTREYDELSTVKQGMK